MLLSTKILTWEPDLSERTVPLGLSVCVSLYPLPLETPVKSDTFISLAETLASEERTDCHVSYSNLDLRSSHFAYDAVTSVFVRYLARRRHRDDATSLGSTSAKSHTNNKIPPACLFTSHRCSSYCLLSSFYCPRFTPHGSTPHPAFRQTLAPYPLLSSKFAARSAPLSAHPQTLALRARYCLHR